MRMVPILVIGVVAPITTACSEHSQVPTAPRAAFASAPDAETLVQEGYVLTPIGWLHKSCVHGIPSGARQVGNVVTLASGASYRIPECHFPAYRNALAGAKSAQIVPQDTGWDEWAVNSVTTTPYRHISASWKVPQGPEQGYSGIQVYATFPGLQNTSRTDYILQPVLEWGNGGFDDFGGNYWYATSWHCHNKNACTHSTPILYPSVGDSLYGTVDASSCGDGMCTWTDTVEDVTKGTISTRSWSDSDNYVFAFGGVIETHSAVGGFTSCSEFPSQPMVYTGVTLSDANGVITPTLEPGYDSASIASPDCGFKVLIPNSFAVTLLENPVAASVSAVSPAPPYSDVTAYATATGGLPPYTYAWSVNGVDACGNQSSCTAEIGADGTTTTFTVDVTDAQPESAGASVSVLAGCTPGPCQNRPAKTGSGG
jgi:hypothetical protein